MGTFGGSEEHTAIILGERDRMLFCRDFNRELPADRKGGALEAGDRPELARLLNLSNDLSWEPTSATSHRRSMRCRNLGPVSAPSGRAVSADAAMPSCPRTSARNSPARDARYTCAGSTGTANVFKCGHEMKVIAVITDPGG